MSRFFTRLYWTAYLGYHLCGQTKYPFKPLSVMKQDQARRVRKMVSYAYRWVPYYRETMDRLGLRPSDFRSAQDLTRLPIIENDHLRRDPECFVSRARALDRYCQVRSGGTTGAPRLVYHDARGLFQDKAHTERSRVIITRLLGQLFRYRETRIV
jgi:phenylacetate-coenzyme A ligase PaaK-like adenylate-forming protein